MGMRWPLSATVMCATAAVSFALILAGPAWAGDEVAVAGLKPDRRPEGAPVIKQLDKSPQWYVAATIGVSQPFPPSLRFLDDQGNWFTPFTHPGMTAPYDIRGLHAADKSAASTQSKK